MLKLGFTCAQRLAGETIFVVVVLSLSRLYVTSLTCSLLYDSQLTLRGKVHHHTQLQTASIIKLISTTVYKYIGYVTVITSHDATYLKLTNKITQH